MTGNAVDCNEQKNLVVKAYHLLRQHAPIPRAHIHLFKRIPSQAGLGGGSADAAYTLRLLNQQFGANLSDADLRLLAKRLGADCPFFIGDAPCLRHRHRRPALPDVPQGASRVIGWPS